MTAQTFDFVRHLPPAGEFGDAIDGTDFVALPDDWLVAVTDVFGSRAAIAQGRYKAVNMAGVTMISALMNHFGGHDIPYIFGGDGAAVALSPVDEPLVADVLARCVTFVEEELELVLRAAIVPVSRLRADGFDVRVKLVRVSGAISNFAFVGGGLSHAEKLMKAGDFAIPKAPAGARPDLTGLSCRWTPIHEEGRKIVSLILEPAAGTDSHRFAAIERELLALADGGDLMPADGPGVSWPPQGLELEARASGPAAGLRRRRWRLYATTLLSWFLFKTGMRFGAFDPARYRKVTSLNTDSRKIQDGLRLTLSLDERQVSGLSKKLDRERDNGAIRYGMCVQDSAVLTCYVPSVTSDLHYHFLDGAGGGYAGAASAMTAGTASTA